PAITTDLVDKVFETSVQILHPLMNKEVLIAQPNSPLSYPIQGVELMPLYTITIPGKPDLRYIGVSAPIPFKSGVTLRASLGTFNTLASISDNVVHGRGREELTISTSHMKLLNFILKHITYTNVVYQVSAVDMVSFEIGDYVAKFPVTIRQPDVPKLYDPGADGKIRDLVTITTKTFFRYHKLRTLIKSIRQYYPDIKIIVADDNEYPETIDDKNVEQYIMPFGKGWFAGRNLAISQVTTKYYLWKMVDVLEGTDLDIVGGNVNGNQFRFKIHYELGEDSGCMHLRYGSYRPLERFPNCDLTSGVVNFFLAYTEESRRVGFDPKLQRVAHLEYFMDGLGILRVGSCSGVSIGHQPRTSPSDSQLAKAERTYKTFRTNTQKQVQLKLSLHYFKNRLKWTT
uniref:Glycosyltransferase 2-like domain-containing protein n=1 Tax=Sphenodon punctatus TaxID=8508 RepID=A0A8D0L4T8_SPHPU